jgi:hypothetical protein
MKFIKYEVRHGDYTSIKLFGVGLVKVRKQVKTFKLSQLKEAEDFAKVHNSKVTPVIGL